jgi:phospholipid/cholesterol/gamma-HCH transport system substrate-binding protein
MKDSAVETAVGAVVILIAAAFFYFVYATTERGTAGSGYHVLAAFDNIGAVNVGTDVRMAGIKVGSVVAQELDPETYQARLTLVIDPKVKLADDTTAKISSEGLLGAPYVALEPGGSETMIAEGGEIEITQGAVDFWKLVSDTMFNKPATGEAPQPPPAANAPEPAPDLGETQTPQSPPAATPQASDGSDLNEQQ